jgi:hypothetical protein
MAAETTMNMDEPEKVAKLINKVAKQINRSIRRREKGRYIGFAESFFVRINFIMPGLVDRAVRRQNLMARRHAENSG